MPRPKKTRSQSHTAAPQSGERLQKVLASAGLGSRRKCEDLITQGRVEIDRQTVMELGTRVNPLTQEIRVDGQSLRQPRTIYFMVNKPPGVLSTNYDPEYRVRVVDLVNSKERLFTVGRLDQYSEGLILVTNDGELANRLMHPRYGAEKTYHILVAGVVEVKTIERLKKGVHLAEGMARVASLKIKRARSQSTDLEMVLREGKNRELRRIFAAVGHKVLKLRRVQLGPLKLGELPLGAHRPLSIDELQKLEEYAHTQRKREKPERRGPKQPREIDEDEVMPLIDESDDALAHADGEGPILISDDLASFTSGDQLGAGRRPGAIIAFDDDDVAMPVAPVPETPTKRPPGKFSKKGRQQREERGGKKKAFRRDGRAGYGATDNTNEGGSKKKAFRRDDRRPPTASGGAPKKFRPKGAKKAARRKGPR